MNFTLTDRDFAQLELAIYGKGDPAWDCFCCDNGVVWGAKIIDGVTVIVLRGSETPLDFYRDLQAVADPAHYAGLGPVHPGFLDGMEATWDGIRQHTRGPRVLVGHSLGAARAAILSGLMVLDQQPPLARVVWGEPLSGFQVLADLIRDIPTRSYRNGDQWSHDPVTDLPVPLGIERYVRASPLVDICARPMFWLSLDWHHIWPLGWHDMEMYAKGTPDVSMDRVPCEVGERTKV
jgi:hypothetical protein